MTTGDQATGGMLTWPLADAGRVLARWRRLSESSATAVRICRAVAQAPVVAVVGTCAAQDEDRVLGALRELRPHTDTWRPLEAREAVTAGPVPPAADGGRAAHRLRAFPEAAVDALVEVAGARSGCSLALVEVRHLRGPAGEERDGPYVVEAAGAAGGPVAEGGRGRTAADLDALAVALAPWTVVRCR